MTPITVAREAIVLSVLSGGSPVGVVPPPGSRRSLIRALRERANSTERTGDGLEVTGPGWRVVVL